MSEDQSNSRPTDPSKKETSSGATGDSGSTGGKEKDPNVRSSTPENTVGKLNPSAPGNAGTTPGSNAENG